MQISNLKFQIFVVACLMCCSTALAQESLESRFKRALLDARAAAVPIESAPESETVDPVIVEPVEPVEPVEQVEILPVPDPLFAEQPILTYSAAASRQHYVVFFTADWCGFCKTWKRQHFPDLEAAFPGAVTEVDIDEAPEWADKVERLPTIWLCRKSDRMPVKKWTGTLRVPEIIAASEALSERSAVANITHGVATSDTFAAALVWHMCDGQIPEEDSAEVRTFGSLINVDVDAPDFVFPLAQKILIDQKIAWPDQGLSLDWSAGVRTITVAPGRIEISPGVDARVSKFRITKSCTLDAMSYTPDLRHVTFELTGMLDLTVNLN